VALPSAVHEIPNAGRAEAFGNSEHVNDRAFFRAHQPFLAAAVAGHRHEIISPWRMCPDPGLVHCVERVSKMLELWLHKMVHVVLVCGAAPQRRDACSNQVLCFDSLYAWTNYDDPRRPLPPNLTLLLKQVRKHCICWWSRVEPRPNNAAVAKTKHAVALTRNSTARHSTPACWLHRHKFDVENERGTAWYAWG